LVRCTKRRQVGFLRAVRPRFREKIDWLAALYFNGGGCDVEGEKL
jgi:hypothetical protein